MARAPDTLKPYQPTLRNRISTALLGDAKASSVRGRFVKGLMGDTGLSATGLGIVDLLPFLQADEAGRQLATKGQRGAGAANLALSVIPIPAVANKLVKPAVKKAAKGVSRLIGDVVGEAAPTVSRIADAMQGSRPIPVPVVGGPPRNAEGFSAPLDMSQEARMARAAEQGFTTPAFHGTNQPIQEFSPDRLGSASFAPSAREAFFATSDPRIAEGYAESAASKTHTDIGAHEQMVAHLESEAARLQRIAEKSGRAADWDAAEAAMQAWEDFEIGAMRSESTGQNILPLRLRMGDAPAYDAGGAGPAFTREALGADFADVVAQQKAAGARGVTFRNLDDTPGVSLPGDHYAVFNPADIRSSFDPFHPGGEARVGLPRPGDYKVGGSLPPVPVVMPRAAGGAATPPVPVTQPKITAYHGSPHDFDQFSLDKIGTGEGAQAYGHGLYFAENEDVAKSYRDQLALDAGFSYGGKDGLTRDQVAQLIEAEHGRGYLDNVATPRSVADSVMDDLIYGPNTRKMGPERAALRDRLSAAISKSDPGKTYQVGINADPEHFLDWDKPLSEQPPNVQQAVANVANLRGESGGYIWDSLVKQKNAEGAFGEHIADPNPAIKTGPKAATEALREAGVPGIKYLDAGSRGTTSGVGTRNFVVFDEKLITILKKYGWVPGAALPAAAVAEYTKQTGKPPPTVPMV